jgi:tetratricopeptide (TPR) repeat protein
MKFLVVFGIFALLLLAIKVWFDRSGKIRAQSHRPGAFRTFALAAIVLCIILTFSAAYYAHHQPDTQCSKIHTTTSVAPVAPVTAVDYMALGDHAYDQGDCVAAIAAYSKAIALDPSLPEAYNNRAYTNMRLHNYAIALVDLDKAIALRPNYVQALMNRGDIHNFYFAIDDNAAVADYRRVIAFGATESTSVCGHLMLAEHHGWNLGTILDLPRFIGKSCQ